MKKILSIFVLVALLFSSCNKDEVIKEIQIYDNPDIYDNVIEVERNTPLHFFADIHTNLYPGPEFYWYKYKESEIKLDENYYRNTRWSQQGEELYCTYEFCIPISDSLYNEGDHYILGVRFGSNIETCLEAIIR